MDPSGISPLFAQKINNYLEIIIEPKLEENTQDECDEMFIFLCKMMAITEQSPFEQVEKNIKTFFFVMRKPIEEYLLKKNPDGVVEEYTTLITKNPQNIPYE